MKLHYPRLSLPNKLKTAPFVVGGLIFIFILSAIIFLYIKNNKAVSHVIEIETGYIDDYTNDDILMGASHNVFVGKVIGQTGDKQRGIGPETQFSVQVISNIKGSLSGIVTVDQQGGYENGTLYVVSEDDVPGISSQDGPNYLLQLGATYLLATRYNPIENWYTLNPFPTASKVISTDSTLGTTQLQSLAVSDPRVQQLQAAYPHEILLQADVAHNNTLNNYQSLHPVLPPVTPTPTSTVPSTSPFSHTTSTFIGSDSPSASVLTPAITTSTVATTSSSTNGDNATSTTLSSATSTTTSSEAQSSL